MSVRRSSRADTNPEATPAEAEAEAKAPASRPRRARAAGPSPAPQAPRNRGEAEAQYAAARDIWIAAMRAASSGKPTHLATLAITQEAYEAATAEVERWRSGARIPIPVEPEREAGIEVAVGQELTWRRLHKHEEKRPGFFARLRERLTRRR